MMKSGGVLVPPPTRACPSGGSRPSTMKRVVVISYCSPHNLNPRLNITANAVILQQTRSLFSAVHSQEFLCRKVIHMKKEDEHGIKTEQDRHREQYLRFRRQRRQKWGVGLNPLHGLERYGFTDPGSLNFPELLDAAHRASELRVKNPIFWGQVVTRGTRLRDLCSVHELIEFLHVLRVARPLDRDRVLLLLKKCVREMRQDAPRITDSRDLALAMDTYAHFKFRSDAMCDAISLRSLEMLADVLIYWKQVGKLGDGWRPKEHVEKVIDETSSTIVNSEEDGGQVENQRKSTIARRRTARKEKIKKLKAEAEAAAATSPDGKVGSSGKETPAGTDVGVVKEDLGAHQDVVKPSFFPLDDIASVVGSFSKLGYALNDELRMVVQRYVSVYLDILAEERSARELEDACSRTEKNGASTGAWSAVKEKITKVCPTSLSSLVLSKEKSSPQATDEIEGGDEPKAVQEREDASRTSTLSLCSLSALKNLLEAGIEIESRHIVPLLEDFLQPVKAEASKTGSSQDQLESWCHVAKHLLTSGKNRGEQEQQAEISSLLFRGVQTALQADEPPLGPFSTRLELGERGQGYEHQGPRGDQQEATFAPFAACTKQQLSKSSTSTSVSCEIGARRKQLFSKLGGRGGGQTESASNSSWSSASSSTGQNSSGINESTTSTSSPAGADQEGDDQNTSIGASSDSNLTGLAFLEEADLILQKTPKCAATLLELMQLASPDLDASAFYQSERLRTVLWRNFVRQAHPDKHGSSEFSTDVFQRASAFWESMSKNTAAVSGAENEEDESHSTTRSSIWTPDTRPVSENGDDYQDRDREDDGDDTFSGSGGLPKTVVRNSELIDNPGEVDYRRKVIKNLAVFLRAVVVVDHLAAENDGGDSLLAEHHENLRAFLEQTTASHLLPCFREIMGDEIFPVIKGYEAAGLSIFLDDIDSGVDSVSLSGVRSALLREAVRKFPLLGKNDILEIERRILQLPRTETRTARTTHTTTARVDSSSYEAHFLALKSRFVDKISSAGYRLALEKDGQDGGGKIRCGR
ncbi:unnamed protein product [Amoebophrya sp. A25]|nr:unnamed protein product [Amoebophrya sp. A25]|eukprot:GSA25T00014637001.1